MAKTFNKVSDTCEVSCIETMKTLKAEVLEFKENTRLIVVLNKSIKLILNWNGRTYLGKHAGLEFFSNGPTITTYSTGR